MNGLKCKVCNICKTRQYTLKRKLSLKSNTFCLSIANYVWLKNEMSFVNSTSATIQLLTEAYFMYKLGTLQTLYTLNKIIR